MTLWKEKVKNIIHFDNAVITNRREIKGEQNLRYNMRIYKKHYAFDILNNVSEYATLVRLMDSVVNVNRDISIVRYWVFESKYNKALCLTQESLYLTFSPSVGE